jgi:hypothetical protein
MMAMIGCASTAPGSSSGTGPAAVHRVGPTGGEPDGDLSLTDATPLGSKVRLLTDVPVVSSRRVHSSVLAVNNNSALLSRSGGHQLALVVRPLTSRAPEKLISPHRGPTGAVAGSALSSRWAIWLESPSTDLNHLAWRMFAYNLRTLKTTLLTSSGTVSGAEPVAVPGYTGPQISGDRVFWAQVRDQPGRPRVDIYGCQISACTPRVYARGAALPAATTGAIYYVQRPVFAGSRAGLGFAFTRRDLRTGTTATVVRSTLKANEDLTGLAASNVAVAWTLKRSTASRETSLIHIRTLGDGQTTTIHAGPEGNFSYPIATSRYVAWAEGNSGAASQVGGYLLDLRSHTLLKIGNAAGLYDLHGHGSVLAWQVSTGKPTRDVHYLIGRFR